MRRWGRPQVVLTAGFAIPRTNPVVAESERRRQRRQPERSQTAQRQQRRLGAKTLAKRGHIGATVRELFRQQANHMPQGVVHRAHAALHRAHRAGQFDGIGAQFVCRLDQTRRLLGNGETTASSSVRVPGSRAAKQSGSKLNVV